MRVIDRGKYGPAASAGIELPRDTIPRCAGVIYDGIHRSAVRSIELPQDGLVGLEHRDPDLGTRQGWAGSECRLTIVNLNSTRWKESLFIPRFAVGLVERWWRVEGT